MLLRRLLLLLLLLLGRRRLLMHLLWMHVCMVTRLRPCDLLLAREHECHHVLLLVSVVHAHGSPHWWKRHAIGPCCVGIEVGPRPLRKPARLRCLWRVLCNLQAHLGVVKRVV